VSNTQRRLELVADQAGELAAVLGRGARALYADGDLQSGREHYEQAYQLAEEAGNATAMATAALGLAGLWVHEQRTVTGAVLLETRLQSVLQQLDPGSGLALRVRARLAGEADYYRGQHEAILSVLAEARAAGDPAGLAEALSMAHHCLLDPGCQVQRRELAMELIKTSFRTGRRSDLLMGLLYQTADAYLAGDPHAGRLLGELRGHLAQRDHLAVGYVVSAIEVMLAIRAGRLSDAETLAASCAASGRQAGDADADWWHGAQLVAIRWYQGRLAELLPMLREQTTATGLSEVDNSAHAALAVAAALAGDRHTAASSLAALRGSDLARLPRSSSWLATMNGIVEAACLLQDTAAAAQAYELLRPHAQLPMIGSLGVACFGSAQHALGVAALTCGQADQAIEHFRAAVQHNLALGHGPAVVTSRRRLAVALDRRGQAGDTAAARLEREAASAAAAALGIPAADLAPPVPGGLTAELARSGRHWRVSFRGRSVLVEPSVGMLHLAVLIANPRQEVPAADLVAGLAVLGTAAVDGRAPQPVLDHAAIREYRTRLDHLGDELEELDAAGESDRAARAARARAERDWLVAELASTAGLGGRPRAFSDQGERARVAAGKAIRRALARIIEADPVIGEHLRQAVHTGARCSYWPG
jgi:hypothetical protein